ncbi:dethiobiotin synthase [Corynebacterium liangguodongii]|uniref:ATP-dependent dethiobiotin synthetase BioD n=1 Tax=Corynebacterium liangguodongii TaxID=2079535 RepID=A0A2S0WCH4_9CORY|nr:dethiobiotin synthase [Corynebacterium liangguodongii]AWB83444.1 dethiobiotin synthase [Corynebacterium liangguodongii]PWC00466.1 ATP-dependent dethiobiotin synthetase BioD [Corynebacterium liangguodongii]
MIICVTGTNTDVGKTVATAALASVVKGTGRRVAVAKPLQTGEPQGAGDAASVASLARVTTHEFARYPEPLAPNLSARRAGIPQADRAELLAWLRGLESTTDVLFVEGAGGLLVRLADTFTLADIASDLNAPLIVVTSLGLGSLNAAELTVEAARARGLTVLGLIGGSLAQEPDLATRLNVAELPVVTGVPLIGCLPAGMGSLEPGAFTEAARGALGSFSVGGAMS